MQFCLICPHLLIIYLFYIITHPLGPPLQTPSSTLFSSERVFSHLAPPYPCMSSFCRLGSTSSTEARQGSPASGTYPMLVKSYWDTAEPVAQDPHAGQVAYLLNRAWRPRSRPWCMPFGCWFRL